MDQLQQYSSLAVWLTFSLRKKKKHLLLRSFWQAAAVFSIYTSITVYCTHKSYYRLLHSVMEWIQYTNQSSATPYDDATLSMDTILFHFYLYHTHTTSAALNLEWVSRLRFSFLPSRTLGHDTLLLMIVVRIKLGTPQLECCTDGNLASDYPVPQAEEGDSSSVWAEIAFQSVNVFKNISHFCLALFWFCSRVWVQTVNKTLSWIRYSYCCYARQAEIKFGKAPFPAQTETNLCSLDRFCRGDFESKYEYGSWMDQPLGMCVLID